AVVVRLLRRDPAVDEPVADRAGGAPVLIVKRGAFRMLRQRVLEVIGDGEGERRRVHPLVIVALQASAGGVRRSARNLLGFLRLGAHFILSRVKGSASGTGTIVPRSASFTGWTLSPAWIAAMLPTTTQANLSGWRCSCATRRMSSFVSFAIF